MEKSNEDLLKKYTDDIDNQLKINEVNIKSKALQVSSYKHYWAARLIEHKRNLSKYEKQKKSLHKRAAEVIQNQSPVVLSEGSIKQSIDTSSVLAQINQLIDDEKIIIEYLEKVEKIWSSLTWDIKNIVELIKMETT